MVRRGRCAACTLLKRVWAPQILLEGRTKVFLYENETSQDETVQVRPAETHPVYLLFLAAPVFEPLFEHAAAGQDVDTALHLSPAPAAHILGAHVPDAGQPRCRLADGLAHAQVNCSGPLQRKPLQEANQNLAALAPAEAPTAAAKPAMRQAPARAGGSGPAAGARPAPPPPPPPLPPLGALARAAKGLAAAGGPAPKEKAENSGPSGTSAGPPARPPPQAGVFVPSVESLQELRAGAPRRCHAQLHS